MSILRNFSEKLHFGQNFDFSQNVRNISISLKIVENLDLSINCRKISILVIVSEKKPCFCKHFEKNIDCSQNFETYRF